ncbi:glycosyltransferase [Chryseobacterium sp. Ch-15]|uniref:Glycosyltransferase n=1 Tax=Chryseobacterium muglaense TaxID=2893752 RepID=A0A9Q3UVR8_9FLAO|nr:glycosyltransferase family 2 protein [Chryseobacterium muglaense]MBD3903819.1 glycosyltransferase family 2 protein [Chryseobacterium muglaense]MCC9034893.1 glycosyltransferase [Chryseobacterium muglaense]MCM2553158.1 glycosyltransferase [Chryseobacterium muglaense]
MPKVSICIPTYNNLEAFKKCLDSVLMQTYTDYEVVVTDDSSNGEIKNYLNENSNRENIFYFKNKKTLGSPENWNEAIRKSKGEYIKILHHDDWFTHENSLEIFVQLLDKNPISAIAFVASKNINLENNMIINYNRPSKEKIEEIKNNPVTLLNGNFIGAPSATIFRKNNFSIFDSNTIWFVDIDFYIQILLQNNNLIFSEIDAISIGASPTQITKSVESNKTINIVEHFYLLNKWGIKKIITSPIEQTTYSLIKKFKIKNTQDIRKLGFKDSLPTDINKLFKKIFFSNLKEKLKSTIRTIVFPNKK